jgi:hypothetical protein
MIGTAHGLLDQCRQRGITLYLDNEDLRFRGLRGAMTPELRQAVAMQRAELVVVLATCPAVPWLPRRHDAEELMTGLHADLVRIRYECHGGAFAAVKLGAIGLWLEVCAGFIRDHALEAARGWDAFGLLRGAVESCRQTACRVANEEKSPGGEG